MSIENLPFVLYQGNAPQLEAPNSLQLLSGPNINLNAVGGSLTVSFSGVLPIASGGTNNATLNVALGGVIYVDGSALQSTGPGPRGMVITSTGAGPPNWQPAFDSFIYSQGGA
jgi:hypothetical protein